MSDNVINIFSKFSDGKKKKAKPSKIPTTPYNAYEIDTEKQLNLTILINESIGVLSYNHLIKILFAKTPNHPVGSQHIDLIYTNFAYVLRGHNLDKLLPALKSRTLGTLRIFNSEIHIPPADDELIITKLEGGSAEEYYKSRL